MSDPLSWIIVLVIYMMVTFRVAWALKLSVETEHDWDLSQDEDPFSRSHSA